MKFLQTPRTINFVNWNS